MRVLVHRYFDSFGARPLAGLSQLKGVVALEGALDGHRGQKVCTTAAIF